jgi:hypothetical protein
MLPREHGAWSLLLTPFLAALLVAGRLNWDVLAALIAVLALFITRAPLVALARQRYVWRDPRPESAQATRWLRGLLPALALSGTVLALDWGWAAVWMGLAATALTAAAVAMTVRNRQRSPWFQVVSSAGLAFSAVAAARAATGHFPAWAWILWSLCALHGACGILVVHARLEAIIARKQKSAPAPPTAARAALAVSALATLALALWQPILALAPALATSAQAAELLRMNLDTPLRTVGLRAMALSIAHALILVRAL